MQETANNGRPRIGLALGGGVWRGWAHLGVLSVLEQEGIPIDYIAGASAGALVGSMYCAGLTVEHMKVLVHHTSWWDYGSLVLSWKGLFSFAKLERWMVRMVGNINIEDLPRCFALVTTDLSHGEPYVIDRGPLARAVRASCSVPGFVVPVEMDGRMLGDGGISNNVPASVAKAMGADYIIAVDLFQPYIRRWLGPLGVGLAAIETMVRQSGGGLYAADCLITPNLSGVSYLRFPSDRDLIELGAEAAREALPKLRADLALPPPTRQPELPVIEA
jgi:NTE family protein